MIHIGTVPSLLFFSLVLGAPLAAATAPAEARTALPSPAPAALAGVQVLGPAAPGTRLERMVLVLKPAPAAERELASFLEELQDPGAKSYHRWLTPAQFGERFGVAAGDLDRLTGWLRDQGFRIDDVSQGRLSVTFSGDAGQFQRAFAAPILKCRQGGSTGLAPALAPTLPRELAGCVEGLLGLHPAPRRAFNSGFTRLPARRDLSVLWWHFLTPGDFAAIYNTRPLQDQGIDGAGVDIAIVGRTHPSALDPNMFRHLYGLPAHPPTLVLNGPDPGDLGADEDGEADLDVEWSGAIAPMANVKLVVSASTASTDGVDLSSLYAVDHDLAPIVSVSFGACEQSLGQAGTAFYRRLWAQAAAQGITVVVAAGDSGAAGCDEGSAHAGTGAAVSGLASTANNVAVGGTQFAYGTSGYWDVFNRKYGVSARGYVPEAAWNESSGLLTGFGIWASGGGPSALEAKPAWQRAAGVPADGRRDLPDLSLAAASGNGYLVQTGGWPAITGGTSCGTPAFAGIMALVVQHTGQRQGNPCPALYRLAAAQFSGTGAQVFHDVILGDTNVPGTPGYSCAPGYDLATGLGSVDARELVQAWPKP